MNKVFCIGFNKTGTSSLHALFLDCGLRSIHVVAWPFLSRITPKYFDIADCYSDGEKSDFVQLNQWFPRSVFILNTRNERAWLRSRIKHVMRYNEKVDLSVLIKDPKYGEMAREFFFDEEGAIEKWIIERRIYHKQARAYFADNPRFLDIDVTTDKEWDSKVLSLLHSAGIQATPKDSSTYLHRNKKDETAIADQDLMNKFFDMIDLALTRRRPSGE